MAGDECDCHLDEGHPDLDAAAQAGEISADIDAYELMRGIGSLCVGADNDPRYDARRMVELLIAGLLQSRST